FPQLIVRGPNASDLKALDAAGRVKAYTDLQGARNSVRTTLLQAIAGALFFVTALIAWLQVQTARQGQITGRFTRSIDQIGSDKTDVRLGGIYALKQLAGLPTYRKPIA